MSFLLAAAALGLGLFGAVRCITGDLYLGSATLGLSALLLHATPGLWSADEQTSTKRTDRLAFAGVLLAIVFFRFYRLVPPGLWGDDAINGLLAFDVIDGVIHSPFELVSHAHSWFHAVTNYAIAASFLIFGADLASLRLPGVVAGCASGVLVYAIAGRLFDRPTAVFAGLLFASSPMQIAHSKSLTQVVFGLMFLCTGIYGILRGTQQPSKRWLATGAIALAATVYTYHAAKLAPLVALPLVVEAYWSGETRPRSLVAATAVFALCLVPALASFWNQPEALLARAQAVSILDEVRHAGSLEPLLMSILTTLGIFHVEQGPQYHWFGPGTDPALTPVAAALVLSGLVASLIGWREPRHRLLLWWFAVGLAPAVLSTEAPRAYRALLATPPVFIWAALPLAVLWRGEFARRQRRVLAVAVIAAALVFDFNYYFHRSYTHQQSRWMLGERIVEMARLVRERGDGWTGYVFSPTFTARHESLRLLSRMWHLTLRDAPGMHAALGDTPLPDRGAVFLTVPGTHPALEILERALPGTAREARFDPEPRTWWWGGAWPYPPEARRAEPIAAALLLPTASRPPAPELPVTVSCRGRGRRVSWRDPAPFYDFFAGNFETPTRCTWEAVLEVPPQKPAVLVVLSDRQLAVRVDGERYAPGSRLAPGRHALTIAMQRPAHQVRLEVRWTIDDRGPVLVPPSAWRPAE